ncbi:MAG: hypothetical protein JSS82_04675 [Bacteroidetes bacterium]|nr:hypothetical protein [Bacteroidota bacterium]
MADKVTHEIAEILKRDWEISLPATVSEEEILHQLAKRVAQLIESGPENFFQLMYRLDISEKKLNAVIGDEDVAGKIARLIYERQLQKIKSREYFRNANAMKDDEDLSW